MPGSTREQLRARLEDALLLALLDRGAHTSRLVAVFPDNFVQLTTGKLNIRKMASFIAECLESSEAAPTRSEVQRASLNELLI